MGAENTVTPFDRFDLQILAVAIIAPQVGFGPR